MLVLSHLSAALNSFPEDLWVLLVGNLHQPAVIETLSGAGVATEDEDLLAGGEDGGVLRTRAGLFVALRSFLFPLAVLYS